MQSSNGIKFVSKGEGWPILMLHGLMLDHRSVLPLEAAFAKHGGWRRIYIDLPGMGQSPCGNIGNSDGMLSALQGFIAREIAAPFAVFGYSYGGYLAQGLAATGAALIGLGLMAPVVEPDPSKRRLAQLQVLARDEALLARLTPAQRAEFEAFCVLQTKAVWEGTQAELMPGFEIMDADFIARLQGAYGLSCLQDLQPTPFEKPTLMLAGRQDHIVGYEDTLALLPRFPRAHCTVLDGAGHNLQIEQRALVATLFADWLSRMEKVL